MEKIFIGQAVTGEDFNKLKSESDEVSRILRERGFDVYCNLKPKDERSAKEQMGDAFNEIDGSNIFLGIIRSEKRSEGMLMEIGYVLAKNKKLIIAVNKNVRDKTYVDDMAKVVIEFDTFEDLKNKLSSLEI